MAWGKTTTITTSLEHLVQKNISIWADGVNINQWEKGKPSEIVSLNIFMDDDIQSLGERMIAANKVTANEWVGYMMNCYKTETLNETHFYFQSAFYSDLAKDRIGDKIRDYINKPVKFKVDSTIKQRIYQA
jgi:hypothetical protein